MPITLRAETESRLQTVAARQGKSADALADSLLSAYLLGQVENTDTANEPEDRLSPEEMAASVEALHRSFAEAEKGSTFVSEDVFAATRKHLSL